MPESVPPSSVPDVTPIRSEFASDPDMAELVELFVSEMPQKIEAILASWNEQRLGDVQRLAHQLKGAGGGYGFAPVSHAAAGLEKVLIEAGKASPASSAAELRTKFEELIRLCRRVSA